MFPALSKEFGIILDNPEENARCHFIVGTLVTFLVQVLIVLIFFFFTRLCHPDVWQ